MYCDSSRVSAPTAARLSVQRDPTAPPPFAPIAYECVDPGWKVPITRPESTPRPSSRTRRNSPRPSGPRNVVAPSPVVHFPSVPRRKASAPSIPDCWAWSHSQGHSARFMTVPLSAPYPPGLSIRGVSKNGRPNGVLSNRPTGHQLPAPSLRKCHQSPPPSIRKTGSRWLKDACESGCDQRRTYG